MSCPSAGTVWMEKSWFVVTANGWTLAPVPRGVVTVSGPERASTGTVVVRVVAVTERTTAATPLKLTWVAPGTKPAPVSVTRAPTGPLEGFRAATEGRTLTLKARTAGVGSSLPARSRALTSNVWLPSGSSATLAVVVETNALNGALSRRHAKARLLT